MVTANEASEGRWKPNTLDREARQQSVVGAADSYAAVLELACRLGVLHNQT